MVQNNQTMYIDVFYWISENFFRVLSVVFPILKKFGPLLVAGGLDQATGNLTQLLLPLVWLLPLVSFGMFLPKKRFVINNPNAGSPPWCGLSNTKISNKTQFLQHKSNKTKWSEIHFFVNSHGQLLVSFVVDFIVFVVSIGTSVYFISILGLNWKCHVNECYQLHHYKDN